jgi:hypothetical protein
LYDARREHTFQASGEAVLGAVAANGVDGVEEGFECGTFAVFSESLAVALKPIQEAGELWVIGEGYYRLVGGSVEHAQVRWPEVFWVQWCIRFEHQDQARVDSEHSRSLLMLDD